MKKIIINIFAYFKGILLQTTHFGKIGSKNRIFFGTSINLYSGSNYKFGSSIKIDKNSVISVLKDANLKIDNNVGIGPNNFIICHKKILIGEGTITGPSVYIYDHDHTFTKNEGVNAHKYNYGEVVIGKNCWIGANTVILKGTHIGNNCIIGAGSVLKGNYPSGSLIIQKRETEIHSLTK